MTLRRSLLAVGVLLLAAILLQPFWLAPLVGGQLTRSAGRSVHFDRMWIGLSSSLQPVVQWRGVRIDNAPWADSPRPFATLASAATVFSWQSLPQRRPVIDLMVLRDGEVDLERSADGLRNWRLSNPDYRGPGRYKVLSLQAERASLRFRHEGAELDLRASARPRQGSGAGADAALPTQIEIEGEWRRLPFKVSAATEPALTFLETGRTFALRGFVESGGARLEVDGRAGDIVHDPLIDARVALTAPSLGPFAAFIESRHHEARALRLEGSLKTGDGSYALSAAKGRIGATDLAGELGWTHGEPRSTVRATLTSEAADLGDLRWLAGVRPRGPQTRAPDAAASSASAADPGRARTVDAELKLVARRLHAAGLPWLQSAQIDASLVDGRLAVPRFDVGIAQGHVAGRAGVDLRDGARRVEIDAALHGARVEQLLPESAAKGKLSGALDGRAQLTASGDSIESLLSGAEGSMTATLSGGTISSLLDAEIGLQGGKIMRSLLAGAEPIAIRCAAAAVDFGRGSGRIRSLVLDTERTRTTGTGVVDLVHETIDLVLTPEAKQPGLFVLERSIRLHGPLRGPAHELVARAPPASTARCGRP